jgi:hypothetical protein
MTAVEAAVSTMKATVLIAICLKVMTSPDFVRETEIVEHGYQGATPVRQRGFAPEPICFVNGVVTQ